MGGSRSVLAKAARSARLGLVPAWQWVSPAPCQHRNGLLLSMCLHMGYTHRLYSRFAYPGIVHLSTLALGVLGTPLLKFERTPSSDSVGLLWVLAPPFVLPEVLADVRSEVHMALAEKDEQAISLMQEAWRRTATAAFSRMSTTECDGYDEKRKSRHRVKTYEWLLATDHMLWVSANLRWSDFFLPGPGGDLPPPQQWRVCSLSVDQGSDGWGGAWYPMAQRSAGLLLMKDPSHRLWNDTLLSLDHSGLRALIVLMICILNADHGPWSEQRWIQSARESAKAYLSVSDFRDPLFLRYADRITQEMGLEHRADEGDSLLQEIWASVPECVYRVTDKVASSRWFGVFNSLDRFMTQWTRRRLVLQYMGVGLDLFKCEPMSVLAKLNISRVEEGGDIEKAPTKREAVDIASLRKSSKNTLQLCYLGLADDDFFRAIKGLALLVRPIKEEYQWQHKLIRSTPEALSAYVAWSGGHGRKALSAMIKVFEGVRQGLPMPQRFMRGLFSGLFVVFAAAPSVNSEAEPCLCAIMDEASLAEGVLTGG